MTTRAAAALGGVLAIGLALSGCGSTGSTAAPASAGAPGSSQAEAVAGDGSQPVVPAQAGHLHGMGVDPADGRLYLGTHGGLLVVEPDGVHRVGEATIDLMGFAVAGPQHFYASGHPGPGDDLPDPVGLIESTDGGLTWTPLSLTGESDFHALAVGDDRVYGFDGRILATDDGVSWTAGAEDVRPASLAVRPGRPDTVLATTEHGPVRSEDSGATFTHVAGAPLLVLLAWTEPDVLWGVAPDGGVHLSTDEGTTWELRGSAGGPPEAFTAVGESSVVVATADRIVRSADGGRTFTTVARRG